MTASKRKKIADAILAQVEERGSLKSICPSDVARALFSAQEWRDEMESVREVAQDLSDQGLIEVTQKGKQIKNVLEAHGPIRLRKVN
ncbi:MAG: DUF3253 domain-containing protein [Cyanobacteria bacterium SZAS-4]|nr:DUF3253 domain-containing protein [Cyanobacteria bacterium SZAS-4]